MITLIQGDKKRFDIQGQSIKAIQFDSTNVRTSGTAALCNDFGAVDVSIVLYQGGKETTIASGSLQPLAMASGFQNASWIQSFGLSATALLAGSTGSSFQSGMINFGGTINLRGNDKLTVEVRCNTGFLPANSNTSTSNLVVAGVEGIGLQWVTPKIQYQTIGNGESNFRQNIGDNCTSLHYVNIAEVSNLTAVQPISNLRIFSDRYNVNDSLTNLLSKRTQQFQTMGEASLRCSNFQLINQEVDDCRVELDLVSAQVTTGENYVVWSTFDTGEKQVQRAKRSKAKHTAKAMRKLRRNPRG
jgi:hypothetical protein